MTHKIKVQMFGNFRMDYNGAPFVAEKMHKESQFNRMMQALIHYSDCGIAKDKLEEIVIGERDIDAPHTALRVIVYKTKQKLAQLGLPGKNLVYLEGGIYYWTPDIEIEEDAAEFEKGSYFFYEQLLADNKENTNLSADLRNVAKLLKESGSYTGALNLNYREFARIYEFVNNVGDRHKHNCYLVMVTMNTLPEQLADIEEIEKALDCMEQSIRSKIRKVDVCTRYSSMQYLIILFEPQENQIPNVMERIFMHYYELCDREDFKPQYEYIKMTEVK